MKKKSYYLMMLAAVVVGIMAFTACGGGGGTSAGGDDSDPTDIPEPQEDANEPLYGTWFGVSGSNVITKLVFASGGNGYIKMNSTTQPYSHNGRFSYQFNKDNGNISMYFNDTNTSATYRVSSLTSESMTFINDYNMTYHLTLTSYSTEIPTEYDNSADASVQRADGSCISMSKSNSRYTSLTYFHYYKKTLDNGAIDLYKDQACLNLVGRASTNTYTSWGNYSVGSYQYIVKTSTDNSWIYYFFN